MKKQRLVALIIAVIMILGFVVVVVQKNGVNAENSFEFFSMDTVMKITYYGDDPEHRLQDRIHNYIYDLDNKLSVTNEQSEIYKLNNSSGEKIKVSYDTYEILKRSVEIAKKTDGGFDPTIYPVVKLWGFTTGKYRVPPENEIKNELKKVDYNNIELFDGNLVRIKPGTMVDLGACAKGYLSDRICEMIREEGRAGIVSLGGNVQTVGSKPDGNAFVVGIVDPFDTKSIYKKVDSSDTAVVTSGNYERYFEEGGKRYHHIFDKSTGAPAQSGIASVTVSGEEGFLCDAYATAIFVKGEALAREFVSENPGYKVDIIYTDKSSKQIG